MVIKTQQGCAHLHITQSWSPTSCPFKSLQYHPCPIKAADLTSYLIHLITPLQNICIQYFIPWSAVSFMTKTQGPVLKLQGGNNFHLFYNRSLKSLWTFSLSVCPWPPLANDSWLSLASSFSRPCSLFLHFPSLGGFLWILEQGRNLLISKLLSSLFKILLVSICFIHIQYANKQLEHFS